MGIAALILGIVSIVIGGFSINYYVGIACGIVGIILAAIARKNGQRGVATAGLVLSIIGLSLSVVLYIACLACVSAVDNALDNALDSALNNITF